MLRTCAGPCSFSLAFSLTQVQVRWDIQCATMENKIQRNPCEIDGASLLSTEMVLADIAPRLVPFVQRIRDGGPSNEEPGSFDMYNVGLSVREATYIKDALIWAEGLYGAKVEVLSCLTSTWKSIVDELSV
jgi:hypothetical protein